MLFCTLASFAQTDTLKKDGKVPATVIIADTTVQVGQGKGGTQVLDTIPQKLPQKKKTPVKITEPAQEAKKDTLVKAPKVHSAKKATIYSAILPGLGQAYNRKGWKIPIIYTGFAALGYAVYFTNDNYQEFRQAYGLRLDTLASNDTHPLYSTNDLQLTRDYWHRNRDLSIVGCIALYTLQVIDATVDGHLYKFEEKIKGDLSLEVEPQPFMGMMNGKNVNGFKVTIRF